MKNPFITLDDLLLDAANAVVQKASKYGYTKYDLKNICDVAFGVSLFGHGLYGNINTVRYLASHLSSVGSYLLASFSVITNGSFMLGGFVAATYFPVHNRKKESAELRQLLETGAAPLPDLSPQWRAVRLLLTAISPLTITEGVYFLATAAENSDPQERLLSGLTLSILGLADGAMAASTYLKNSTMIPPQGRKFHHSLMDKIKSYFSGRVPQTAEVTVPNRYEGLEKVNTTEI